ncbi:MAG TPA: response regulator [Clostridia bacterium]|nr:response regulator [Clostridia bacterium]
MRMSLRKIVSHIGFNVIAEAENGLAAVAKFKELRPDVVTLDITMPEMNGIEALKEIKKIDPDVRAIIVSAMGQENNVREAVLNGARDFILKPFKEENGKRGHGIGKKEPEQIKKMR